MKKYFLFFVFILSLFSVYAFEPEKYIKDELENIALSRSYSYYYDWGTNTTWKTENVSPQEFLLEAAKNMANNFTYNALNPKPKNINESKVLAQFIWSFIEYKLVRSDAIIVGRK